MTFHSSQKIPLFCVTGPTCRWSRDAKDRLPAGLWTDFPEGRQWKNHHEIQKKVWHLWYTGQQDRGVLFVFSTALSENPKKLKAVSDRNLYWTPGWEVKGLLTLFRPGEERNLQAQTLHVYNFFTIAAKATKTWWLVLEFTWENWV